MINTIILDKNSKNHFVPVFLDVRGMFFFFVLPIFYLLFPSLLFLFFWFGFSVALVLEDKKEETICQTQL